MKTKKNLTHYNNSWTKFRIRIDKLTKDRCKLSNKNWKKLEEIHLEQFLDGCQNVTYFIFHFRKFRLLRKYKPHLFQERLTKDSYLASRR